MRLEKKQRQGERDTGRQRYVQGRTEAKGAERPSYYLIGLSSTPFAASYLADGETEA